MCVNKKGIEIELRPPVRYVCARIYTHTHTNKQTNKDTHTYRQNSSGRRDRWFYMTFRTG